METAESLRQLDKQIAIALGFFVRPAHQNPRLSKEKQESLQRYFPDSLELVYPNRHTTYSNNCTTEDQAWRRCPKFTTDPAAADLVRQEIKRRGWKWIVSGGDFYKANIWGEGIEAISYESPHHALCLAFLAAVEAQGEVSP